jgi:hypothetical protein
VGTRNEGLHVLYGRLSGRRFTFRRSPSLRRGGMNQLKAGSRQEFTPRSATRGPVGLTEVCVEAVLKASPILC